MESSEMGIAGESFPPGKALAIFTSSSEMFSKKSTTQHWTLPNTSPKVHICPKIFGELVATNEMVHKLKRTTLFPKRLT